jgi:hypothetical protein
LGLLKGRRFSADLRISPCYTKIASGDRGKMSNLGTMGWTAGWFAVSGKKSLQCELFLFMHLPAAQLVAATLKMFVRVQDSSAKNNDYPSSDSQVQIFLQVVF